MPTPFPSVEINPAVPAAASMICLHGLGADGHDLIPIAAELALPEDLGLRFIFPHAPYRPVTVNSGYVRRAWYDIAHPVLTRDEDSVAIRESERLVRALIQGEIDRGVAAKRIVLAGFSQGGAIALHTGLRYSERLAGVLALSTYLPLADTLESEASAANRGLEILLAHGAQDPLVPLALATTSRTILQRLKYDVAWHIYPMGHGLCAQELRDIARWLLRVLG